MNRRLTLQRGWPAAVAEPVATGADASPNAGAASAASAAGASGAARPGLHGGDGPPAARTLPPGPCEEPEAGIAPLGRYPASCRAGDTVYVSGMSARQADGSIAGVRYLPQGGVVCDCAEQTRVAIAKVAQALEREGASLDDCVAVTVYLTDMADFDAYNKVYGESFNGRAARATVAVHQLPHPHMAVELSVTAYAPLGRQP